MCGLGLGLGNELFMVGVGIRNGLRMLGGGIWREVGEGGGVGVWV